MRRGDCRAIRGLKRCGVCCGGVERCLSRGQRFVEALRIGAVAGGVVAPSVGDERLEDVHR